MIKLVAFDLDDTLYNEKDFVYGAFKEVARYIEDKFDVDGEEVFNEMKKILYEDGRGKIFNVICEKYKLQESVEDLVKVYRNSIPKMHLCEDSYTVLNELKTKYKLGLITDGMASVQRNKIKALGIEAYFDKIIVTDEYGKEFWKPHIRAYEEMYKAFNLLPSECLYVGDNPHKDFIGAKASGFYTIRIIRELGDYANVQLEKEREAERVVVNLMGILPLIDNLL